MSRTPYKIAFSLTGIITLLGLYTGFKDDIWGWVFYAIITLVIGFLLLKKSGTQQQVHLAKISLKIFVALSILACICIVVYMKWMSGLTF